MPTKLAKPKITKAVKEAITKEEVSSYAIFRHKKLRKPRQFPGKDVIQKDRNDGIRVCLIHELFQGKQIDKLCFFRIFETEDGIFWKCRKMKRKKGGIFEMWDVVSINRDCARRLANAILDVAGEEGELPEERARELKGEEEMSELLDIAKDFE